MLVANPASVSFPIVRHCPKYFVYATQCRPQQNLMRPMLLFYVIQNESANSSAYHGECQGIILKDLNTERRYVYGFSLLMCIHDYAHH